MRLLSPLPATFSAVCLFRARVAFTQSSPNFSVPTSWQNTTSSLSRDDRQAIAQSAIQRIPPPTANGNGTLDVSGYNFDHVQTSSLLSVLFLYDFFSGTTTNKNRATVIHEKEFHDPPTTNMSHILHWGLANYYAYRVYQDNKFLQEAIGSWKNASGNMITQEAIQNGTLKINPNGTSQNTVPISVPSPSCSPSLGAVFEFPDQDHLSTVIKGETMGAFLALSAYLSLSGEGNETSDAANLSAEFIQAHMINNHTANPLQFDMSSDPCAVTLDDQNGMMNIGLIIEGLSVLANQTSNATLSNIVNDLIVQSIKHTWTGSNGVITQESGDPEDDQSGAKAWFIRGLHEAWSRMSDKDSGPASLIAAYITVQFNALHNMSPNGDYSTNWTLPSTNASVTFDPWAQVVALDALNSAFDIATPATNSTSASPSSPSPPSTSGSSNLPDRSSTSHVGAIAGGTVGGGVAIAVVVGAAIFFFRRRKYRTVNKAPSSFFADRLVSPPSAAFIDQVQDYGLPREEKRGHEESDSTESSLGIAV